MDRGQVQKQLKSAYQRWKAGFESKGLEVEDFSPPLLLNVTTDYCNAPLKIVVYGKETMGWHWTHRLQEEFPKYPNSWPFKDLRTFGDFLTNDDAIEGLIWGYEQFAFAKYQPKNHRSPFWQAIREIQKWPDAGVMHANLLRMDYKNGSIFNADSNARQAIVRQQSTLMRDELRALKPGACIFLTGPDYDAVMEAVFPELKYKQLDVPPRRELARLVHADLPVNSYRTYHPNALSYQEKWDYLDLIRRSLIQ